MAFFSKSQVFFLFCCAVAIAADDFAANDLRRFAKAKKELDGARPAPRRLLRPLKAAVAPVAESRTSERFANFDERPNFQGQRPQGQRDGTEYDEYGNRQKQSYGLGSTTLPRGYNNYQDEPQEPSRPVYSYSSPKRTIDSKRKAVIDEVDPAEWEDLEGYTPVSEPRADRYAPVSEPRADRYAPVSEPRTNRYTPVSEPRPNRYTPVSEPNPSRYTPVSEPRADVYSPVSEPNPRRYTPVSEPRADRYSPASGPAFAPSFASARQDLGPGSLEANVLAGADAYGGASSPDGVYQSEDRIAFQIHGQEGPHSYRYGYDTGSGFNRQFKYEERNGDGYVKGRYGFYDKYGQLQVINYHADPLTGFHAEGDGVPEYPH